MKQKKQNWKRAFRKSESFAQKWEGANWCADMEAQYLDAMRSVLKDWLGVHGHEAVESFLKGACHGNWERLHESCEEAKRDVAWYAEELVGEMFYCSDRWTWDRAMRIHWLYQCIRRRTEWGCQTLKEVQDTPFDVLYARQKKMQAQGKDSTQ